MTSVDDECTSSPCWGRSFACWCAGVGAFQVALAVGAPWGAAAWGGGHDGVLPGRLRLASGLAAAAFTGIAVVAAGKAVSAKGRGRVLLGTGAYATLGVIANGLSPSRVERGVWVPLSAIGALLALQAWREAVRTTATGR